MHILIHALRYVGPGSVNRDRKGNLKTITMGTKRLRFSSQKEKYSHREYFKRLLELPTGIQTRSLAKMAEEELRRHKVDEKKARDWAEALLHNFLDHNMKRNEEKKAKAVEKGQEDSTATEVARIFPEEREELLQACRDLASGKVKDPASIKFQHAGEALDIAMSGRLRPTKVEGAVSVGEAFGINALVDEEDFFTASDDFRKEKFYDKDEAAFAHGGSRFLAASIMYEHIMVNCDQLRKNLPKEGVANQVLRHILDAAYKAAPASGSTNGAHTHTRASYIMVEKMTNEPRSLAPAFEQPVNSLEEGIARIKALKAAYEKEDPAPYLEYAVYFNENGEIREEGSLQELHAFVGKI